LSAVLANNKFFKNQLIFGEDIEKDEVGRFLGHSVV